MVRIGMLVTVLLCSSVSAEPLYRAHHAMSGVYVSQANAAPLRIAESVANQKAGPCIEVAKNVFEGFRRLGKEPTYIKFISEGTHRGANLLAFEMRAGEPRSTIQISENFVHYAVRVENRIYDAFTGPQGLAVAEYAKRLLSLGNITTETVSVLP
jgi:hypothetical protein